MKIDECEVNDREYHKLQEKHRDLLNSEYNLATVKDHLEASLRMVSEEA